MQNNKLNALNTLNTLNKLNELNKLKFGKNMINAHKTEGIIRFLYNY